jgi:aquaporin Z
VVVFYFFLFWFMKKYVVEFIGTMFLVLTIGLAVAKAGDMAPLAIGAVLMAMVYAGGHISGAHYNPAVSLGLWSAGKLDSSEMIKYWISQILGAVVAAGVVTVLVGKGAGIALTASTLAILLSELLFTFALVWVVLNVATTKAADKMSYYGLAIWFTVMAGAYAVGSISGGAFNPAVVIGNAVDWLLSYSQIWMHLIATLVGWLVAWSVFKALDVK